MRLNLQVTTFHLDSMYEHLSIRQLAADQANSRRSYALPIPFGSATATRTHLRSGLEIGEYEGVLTKPLSLRFETKYPHLEISYTTSGYGSWSGEGGARGCEMAPGISTLVYMADSPVYAELCPDDRLSHTEIRIDLCCFEPLGAEVRRLASGGFYSRQVADHPQVAKLFEQLKDCPYDGLLRQLYMEGKCYELLACHLGQADHGRFPNERTLGFHCKVGTEVLFFERLNR